MDISEVVDASSEAPTADRRRDGERAPWDAGTQGAKPAEGSDASECDHIPSMSWAESPLRQGEP